MVFEGLKRAGRWTYQAELQWPDVDTTEPLPAGWSWARVSTIVNSDGTAADPRRRRVTRGAGLTTPWCQGVHHLADEAARMFELLRPVPNYRANLRIRVRIENITNDLFTLWQIADKSRSLEYLFHTFDPLDYLLVDLADHEAGRMAHEVLAFLDRERHHLIHPWLHHARRGARTMREFLAAEVPVHRGRPDWQAEPEEAVNLRRLMRDGSIELRCFATPSDPSELHAAAAFSGLWLYMCLSDGDPIHPVQQWGKRLPRQRRFDHRLETGWRASQSVAR